MSFDEGVDSIEPSSEVTLLRKDQLETTLRNERKLIDAGQLKEDNPLDLSEPFRQLCEAARKGDLKVCQEKITEGVNINGRDLFDCTPLILASLCGHYEVVQLLLESGALCERDTFQGERCLYNALNNKIRNLLLQYDYTKSTNPLQPFAAHLASLLTRTHPETSDILVTDADESFRLHKFILSARSPYFHNKLSANPGITALKLPSTIPPQAFSVGIRYLYLGEAPRELNYGPGTGFTESEVFAGIDRIAKHLELTSLVDTILESGDRRLARQRRTEEITKGHDQMETWFRENVIKNKVVVDTDAVNEVKWTQDNPIFADVLLRADEEDLITDDEPIERDGCNGTTVNHPPRKRKSVLFPVHRAMLLRSEFFLVMFSSGFREAQISDNLQIIPVDCSPEVLEIILTFMYTEKSDFPLEIAVDVLFAADLLLMERLKTKAAVVISTLGNGNLSMKPPIPKPSIKPAPPTEQQERVVEVLTTEEDDQEPIDVYEIIRAGWTTRVQRLEEFAARYLAYRLEAHIETREFEQLVIESSTRIEKRQETDTIELIDDIRYYLSERFRLRFEEVGLDEVMHQLDISKEGNNTADSEEDGDKDKDKRIEEKDTKTQHETQTNTTTADASVDAGANDAENSGTIPRTLDGHIAGDEFSRDAMNYQILLRKLDRLLQKLGLDA